MHRRLLTTVCAASIAFAVPAAARAQSLLGETPRPVEPARTGPVRPLESVILGPVAKAGEAAPKRVNRVLAFEQAADDLRLEGEFDAARLTFTLDPASVAEGGDLVIGYRNAVSVMPEASLLSVRVNGALAGEFPVRSPSGEDRHTLSISPALLRAGVNEVRLEIVQRHRVDCSMEATYELWTEIDPSLSGFRPRRNREINDFNALRTIARAAGEPTDLRLVLSEGSGSAVLDMAAPAVQLAALALNRDDIAVTVADRPGQGPGIDLFIATDNDPVSVLSAPQGTAYGLSVVPGADEQRAAMVLRAPSARDVPGILLAAINGPLKPELDSGIRAPRSGEIHVEPSSTYTLSDVGYEAKPFSGRLFRTRFDLVLPADFYPAEYATMDLALHAATSPGLKPTSQFLVRVNGHIVKSLPIRDTAGEVFEGRRMELPLRAFRPGRNQIELLAELEKDADDRCIFSERDESQPRFILLDNTEIRVPALARVARLPELSAMAGAAWPQSEQGTVTFNLMRPDSRAVSAALTVMTKLATTARSPLPVRFSFGAPAEDDTNSIVIATRRAIDDFGRLGNSAFLTGNDEITFALDTAKEDEIADPIATSSVGLPGAALLPAAQTPDPDALLQAFRQTARGEEAGAPSLAARIGNGLSDMTERFVRWLNYQRPQDTVALVAPKHKATLMQRPAVTGNGTVTWLTADQPSDLGTAARLLAAPAVWNQIEGESVTLDLDTGTLSSQRPQGFFEHRIEDWSIGNLRRITAAWFSDHFRVYVAALLALLAIFAVIVGRAVPKMGVRTDQ